jgi:hypothetical protein
VTDSFGQKRVTIDDSRSAGSPEFRRVQFGLILGLNTSTLRADWSENTTTHAGLNFGPYLKIRFIKFLGLQPGIQLSTQGASWENDERVSLIYMNVPVVLKFYVFRGLNLDFGPNIGFLLVGNWWDPYNEEWVSAMDDFTRTNIDLRLGINYEFNFGLVIATHLNVGVTNINAHGSSFPVNSSVFQLGVGYFF